MTTLATATVLVSGVNGLGVEIGTLVVSDVPLQMLKKRCVPSQPKILPSLAWPASRCTIRPLLPRWTSVPR